ncbi:MAG: hypothetical protein HQ553_16140 [Chloroflexi bacterium]|nr:hypothetical protein [Chloroflexota bacterium]
MYGKIRQKSFDAYLVTLNEYKKDPKGGGYFQRCMAILAKPLPEGTEYWSAPWIRRNEPPPPIQVQLSVTDGKRLADEARYYGLDGPDALARIWILERLRQLPVLR